MSFPAYPAYKDSGVEWQGAVPADWPRSALKYLADYQNGYPFKPDDWGEEGLPIIRISQLTGDTAPNFYTGELDDRVRVNDGDLLFSWSATIDSFIWTGGTAWLNQHIFKVSLTDEADQQFLFYLIKLVAPKLAEFDAHGSTMKHIKKESLSERLHVPTLIEQAQIARFLDHETVRIDALIAEQQRLIELLKEKRQAVISHAVTKGLDPTVPMKDSGVAWLGEVPAHWVVCALRRAIRFIEQGWSPECESYPADDDGWGVLKAGCVNRGVFDPSENKTLPAALKPISEYEVRAGDILMSRASGSPELVGSTALLGQVRERLMLSDKIFRVHLEEKVSSHFFVWAMNAQFMRSQIEQALSGGNGLANNLPQSSLLAFWLAVPPEHEQHAIAQLINEQMERIDELIAEGGVAIEFLQERRSALISAAVTGKIDVRGWQSPAVTPSLESAQEAV